MAAWHWMSCQSQDLLSSHLSYISGCPMLVCGQPVCVNACTCNLFLLLALCFYLSHCCHSHHHQFSTCLFALEVFFTASLSRCILCFLFSPWLYARGFSAIIKNLLPIVISILVYTHMIILVLINIASTSSVCATYLPSLVFCFTLSPFCSRIVLHLVCLP